MNFKFILSFFFIAFALILSYAPSRTSKKHLIVCTTNIIADAVRAIVKDEIEVRALMGPGVDPHLYRPRESDVVALSNASLIFFNGLHLEGKMGDMFVHMRSRIPTIAITDALFDSDLIESEFKGIYDPHVWHDVSLWRRLVPVITEEIIKLDPSHERTFGANAQNYIRKLTELNLYVREKTKLIPKNMRVLLTAHDAFSYFGKAYGFEVVGLQGISTDSVITAHDIQSMVEKIVKKNVPAIFLESSLPAKSIEAVERAVAARGRTITIAPELFSDSLGDKTTTAATYCGMIKHNIDIIVSSLTA